METMKPIEYGLNKTGDRITNDYDDYENSHHIPKRYRWAPFRLAHLPEKDTHFKKFFDKALSYFVRGELDKCWELARGVCKGDGPAFWKVQNQLIRVAAGGGWENSYTFLTKAKWLLESGRESGELDEETVLGVSQQIEKYYAWKHDECEQERARRGLVLSTAERQERREAGALDREFEALPPQQNEKVEKYLLLTLERALNEVEHEEDEWIITLHA